ncbi:MAG: hypothetical protein Q4E02_01360 [Lagierella massiliensis]|nr:hypothetical protein [Lagierella massiliensis]
MKKKILTGFLLILFLSSLFFASYVLFNKYNETYNIDNIKRGHIDGLIYDDFKTKKLEDVLFFVGDTKKDKENLKVMVFEKDFLFKSRYRKQYDEQKNEDLNSIYYGTDKSGYILIFGKNPKENPIKSFEVISGITKKFRVDEPGIILEALKGKAKEIKNLRIEYEQ